MERDKDWIDTLKSRLQDAEAPAPADGWARLERALKASGAEAMREKAHGPKKHPVVVPASRASVWRIGRLRIVAAAALVVLFIGAGEFLWQRGHGFRNPGGTDMPLAEKLGWGNEPQLPKLSETLGDAVEKFRAEGILADALAADAPASRSETHRAMTQYGDVSRPDRFVPQTEDASEEVRPAKDPAGVPSPHIAEMQSDKSVPQTEEQPRDREPRRQVTTVKSVPNPAAGEHSDTSARKARNYSAGEGSFLASAAPRKKSSFSLYAGGALTGAGGKGGASGNFVANMDGKPGDGSEGSSPTIGGSAFEHYDRKSNSFKHHQPLSFGLTVRKEFAHGLSLETGVNYTLLRSEVSYWKGAEEFSQKLHFIGVPLRLNWQFFERGRFSTYIGAGGMLEKCVAAKFGTRSVEEPAVQWSVSGAAGVQYRLGNVVGLYFEPEVSYYFTDTRLRTSRSDAPLTLTLRLGMRFSF